MRWRGVAARLALLLSLLAGCQDQTDQGGATGVRVAVVPPGFSSPFHVAIRDGAVRSAHELGWSVDVMAAEREGDFAGQVAVVEQEIQKGVAAIGVNPIDAKAIVAAVKKANRSNVPVFMQNTITPLDEGEVVEYIGYDQWKGAARLAQYACGKLGGQGSVFILTGIPGFHANRRTEGFIWGLQRHCPAVQVAGLQTAEWEREKAINVATAALQKDPQIKLFYGNSDEMAIGACLAARKQGRTINRDIYCLGIDGNPVTLELIAQGELTATLGVYPDKIGETLIRQMDRHLRGEPIPKILETPSIVVDAQNLESYRQGSTWEEPREGRPELDNGRP